MKFTLKLYLLLFSLLTFYTYQNQLIAQPFTPDKHGYVKDPKFHKLIKEKGYELVADFHKVESGNDSLYASVYINGTWKYINVYGEVKTDKFDYQKRNDEYEVYSRDYSSSDFLDDPVEVPRMENSKPYSNYFITKPAGKKWGTVNSKTKKQGLPYIYDRIFFFNPNIVVIAKNKKFGLAYCTGKIIVPPTYQELQLLNNSSKKREFLTVKQDDKYGLIDSTGKIIIPIKYDRLYKCHNCGDNLIKVFQNNRWGLISSANKIILPTSYSEIKPLSSYVIRTKSLTSRKYGLITSKGKFILDTICDRIENKRYGNAIKYRKEGKEGMLSYAGKPIVPPVYDHIEDYKKGYAQVIRGSLRGLINRFGREVIPTHYKVLYIDSRKGQIMALDSNNKWGYIDFKNKVKVKFEYEQLENIGHDEYFFKKDGVYGLMTSKEVVFKKFKYKNMYKIGAFYVVKENKLSGIIDENENILLPIKYSYIKDAHDFYQHGYCKVRINGQYYGVDRYGNEALLKRR